MGAVDDVGADEDDPPLVLAEVDQQRLARQLLFALQPAREQQVAFAEDQRRGAAFLGRLGQRGLEGRRGLKKMAALLSMPAVKGDFFTSPRR